MCTLACVKQRASGKLRVTQGAQLAPRGQEGGGRLRRAGTRVSLWPIQAEQQKLNGILRQLSSH